MVINFLASGLEQRFNQKEFASFVKRPYYDVGMFLWNDPVGDQWSVFRRGESALFSVSPSAGRAQQE